MKLCRKSDSRRGVLSTPNERACGREGPALLRIESRPSQEIRERLERALAPYLEHRANRARSHSMEAREPESHDARAIDARLFVRGGSARR